MGIATLPALHADPVPTPKAVADSRTVPLRNHLRGWGLVLSGNPKVLQTQRWSSQALQARDTLTPAVS
jgi:hypothetical protein